mmetsp:Transcript_17918/g.21951  ORF Transcript_17918/g.21951 Transcript_17918/m.21951 type:complete len:136 (-) Transcript_17918:242-649(-)
MKGPPANVAMKGPPVKQVMKGPPVTTNTKGLRISKDDALADLNMNRKFGMSKGASGKKKRRKRRQKQAIRKLEQEPNVTTKLPVKKINHRTKPQIKKQGLRASREHVHTEGNVLMLPPVRVGPKIYPRPVEKMSF